MTYGLTPTGFVKKPREVIRAELEAELRASLGADVDTSPGSVLGNVVDVATSKFAESWDVVERVYNARSPDGASDATLSALAEITGTRRAGPTRGVVRLRLRLAANTAVPKGAEASDARDGAKRWRTLSEAVNATASAADVDVVAESVTAGTIEAAAGTITRIASPVAGWLSVTNIEDAAPGREIELDAELRARRVVEVSQPGQATEPAIRADLMTLERRFAPAELFVSADELARVAQSIVDVDVRSNRSAWPDAEGRPPHSVEVVVRLVRVIDPTLLSLTRGVIALALATGTPAGVEWFGSRSATVTDANGVASTVRWSETTDVPVRVDVVFPAGVARPSSDAIRAAVLAYGASLRLGGDVVRSKIIAAVSKLPGFADLLDVRLGRDQRQVFTVDAVTDLLTAPGHVLTNGSAVELSNLGGALPSPLDASSTYFARDVAAEHLQLAPSLGGSAVNILDAGVGTHFVYASSPTISANLSIAARESASFDSSRVFVLEA